MTRRLILQLLAVMLLALVGAAQAGDGGVWSAREASAAVQRGEMILLDIRTPKEWAQSGVPGGAWPVDLADPGFGKALGAVLERNPGKTIGVICATGGRSDYVTKVLKKNGISNIVDIGEGMFGSRHGAGWIKAGLPLVSDKDALAAMPADFTAR